MNFNECTECGLYRAEFWVCDDCRVAVDLDPASDHDVDTFIEAEDAKSSNAASAAVQAVLGCGPYRAVSDLYICVVVGHDEEWTDRGCPVSAKAAEAALEAIR